MENSAGIDVMAAKKEFLYKTLARHLAGQIRDGVYGSGQKLPSVNHLKKTLNLSVNTVFKAYVELETMGLVEARPRSGYYVRPKPIIKVADNKGPKIFNARKDQPLHSDVIRIAIKQPDLIPFGQAAIAPGLFPRKKMAAITRSIGTRSMEQILGYGPIPGNLRLRRKIAERMLGLCDRACPDSILITNGCMEAIALALMSVARPGDAIALECPTFFGYMQILKELNLSIVEIPTCPSEGMDLCALEQALETRDIKACLVIPNFHNPLGCVMPDENKKALVRVTSRRGIPVIEDDIYSDLFFGKSRPSLLKTYDHEGQVIVCSSFSKTLSPGFRIGWIMADEDRLERIRQIKFSISMMTTSLDQFLLAEYLDGNGYDRHLRTLRSQLKKQLMAAVTAVAEHFPQGTRCRMPDGGFVLWIQLPDTIDAMDLYQKAMDQNIAILPGNLCSFSKGFTNCIRVNCGFPHDPRIASGFKQLGDLATTLSRQNR